MYLQERDYNSFYDCLVKIFLVSSYWVILVIVYLSNNEHIIILIIIGLLLLIFHLKLYL
jgi:hypothetical protein